MANANNADVFIDTEDVIIKEEIIIPDELGINTNHDISLETSCKQTKRTNPVTKRDKVFLEKIKKRICDLNRMKCSQNVKDTVVKNATAPIRYKLKSPVSTRVTRQSQSSSEKSDKSECTSPTISSKSILKPKKTIKPSTCKTLASSSKKVSEAPSLILKLSSMTDLPKIANLKPHLQSALKLAIPPENKDAPLILKLPMAKAKSVIESERTKEDKSTILIKNNNFTEIKKEVVDADLEEQSANRNKRFYHAVCVNCKKLRQPDNENGKCEICQEIFHYECMRCRDTLTSKHEYYNHLKNKEFCTELHIPPSFNNISYALAIRLERNECTVDDWEKMHELAYAVRKARIKFNRSKFNRIRCCCPVCDMAQPVEDGNFYCEQCSFPSVFKCLTCDKNYTSYTGAIYHIENHLSKEAFFEYIDFKKTTKEALDVNTQSSHWRKHAHTCRKKIHFNCALCSEKYLTKEEIISHLSLVHQMADNGNNREEKKRRTYIGTFITPYCIDCNIMYEVLNVTDNYNCLECEKQVGMQCKICQKIFEKYTAAYFHIKNSCRKNNTANMEKKNDESKKQIMKGKRYKNVKKNTKEINLDEMQLDKNDIKVESPDIKVFDGLLDFDKFEAIIPDEIHQ